MNSIAPYLEIAGLVQLAIAGANFVLPKKLRYAENLSRVDPIIRQVFVVHSVYIVFVLVVFSALCLLYAPELAGERAYWGGFCASGWRCSGHLV